ncbi:MAG: DNA processing protein DprA [Chitinophagales bacterium]|nr:MAG: DNA processing protein DprA [Chitinophagales bacterium]
MDKTLLYKIGLTLLPGIGPVLARNLISWCGGVEEVFRSRKARLEKIPGIGRKTAEQIASANVLSRAEEEIRFIEKNHIRPLFFQDEDYPARLKECYDSPLLLYYKGNADLNAPKTVALVGTRNATDYGKAVCEKIIEALAPLQVLVISGLAYGIDITAHKASLSHGLKTVGVLGHGMRTIYPSVHRSVAQKMLTQGGLLTEFLSDEKPNRENFPTRNRIIAGLADALIVVETRKKGGAIITAEVANTYNREVFAVPGNIDAPFSEGCNFLIRTNKAALLDDMSELIRSMQWSAADTMARPALQAELFSDLNPHEQQLVNLLKEKQPLRIDELSARLQQPSGTIASSLLALELKGIIKSLPGKRYQLNGC